MSEYESKKIKGKNVPVHRLLVEEIQGRKLEGNEVVHHVNGDKKDNRPENLVVMDRAEHTRMHATGRKASPETVRKQSEAQKGKRKAGRKLSDRDIREVVVLLREGLSYKEIGRRFGVTDRTINSIAKGETYKDVLNSLPADLWPMPPRGIQSSPKPSLRSIDYETLARIRIGKMEGEAAHAVSQELGIPLSVVRQIWEGKTYKDVEWPELKASYYESRDIRSIVDWILSKPESRKESLVEALLEDYSLIPNRYAIIALKMVRRALAGDDELALFLVSMGMYDEDLA